MAAYSVFRWSRSAVIQKAFILLVLWGVYLYRDVWPLATYNRTPVDVKDGFYIWLKISLLTFAAVILPLVSPRHPPPGVPVWNATVEQTASILSAVTYAWMDPFIKFSAKLHATQGGLQQEQLPPLPGERKVQHLVETSYQVRSFRAVEILWR